ncbi:PDR/VanB family oxidoreductase [Nocardioides sp.]|uniref:PDR/VanB family oxidoreductase n=1 Tax=Nocardioides sp. TaxID=35761 RepID=UPI00261F3314|nr:PDR/VanB family oxidoreductase [Nocardioides sp.]
MTNHTALAQPSVDVLIDLVLTRRLDVADGVVELTFTAPDGTDLPAWEPGAHLDLLLAPDLDRQYSLCGPRGPETAAEWTVAVRREAESRGGSALMHDLAVGAALRCRMPRNHFTFAPVEGPVTFVAGGIGITPLLPMIEAATAAGRTWVLHYAGRSRASMAYAERLVTTYGDRVRLHVDDEGTGLDLSGVVQGATQVWCCGPAGMLAAAEELGLAAGVPVHVEHFTPKEVGAHVDTAFEIEAGGRVFEVPADRSALDVIEEEGFLVVSSCREGTCGTCETVLLEGEGDHRDSILSSGEQAENRLFYPCVSRARSPRLVLDLF